MTTPQLYTEPEQITLEPNTTETTIDINELLINKNSDDEYDSNSDDASNDDDDDDVNDINGNNSSSDIDSEEDEESDDDEDDNKTPKFIESVNLNNDNEIKELLKMNGGDNINLEVDDDSLEEYDTDNIEDDDSDYSDTSDMDDSMNDDYFKKFEKTSKIDYIKQAHPEEISHNSDEVIKLSQITRINNCIVDPFHKSIPILSKYEKTQILGQRSVQIENGATPFIHVPDNIINSHIIAEMELAQKKIPFIIRRPMNDGTCEYWKISDLEILY
jgi:DNA-directed RNA polymerase subunit K/omega